MKLPIVAVVIWALGSSVAWADDNTLCAASQSVTGSFFSGRTYSATELFPTIKQSIAFKRTYIYILQHGWKIIQSDKDIGAISATQDVVFGESSQAPLSALIEESGTGSKVTLTLSIGMGQTAEAAPGFFCEIMKSVAAQ